MNQPYAAPGADLQSESQSRYQPRLFQVKGRLGRVRYFVYALTITLIVYLVFAAVAAVAALAGQPASEPGGVMFSVMMLVLAVGGVFAAVMSIIYGVRRLNDMNVSGWLILLMFGVTDSNTDEFNAVAVTTMFSTEAGLSIKLTV